MENINLSTDKQYSLTTFLFYNEILPKLHEHYKSEGNISPIFSMIHAERYEPSVIPLIVCLGDYLKRHHGTPIELKLSNDEKTNEFLFFMESLDFFKIVGNHDNPYWVKSRNIYKYDEKYIGRLLPPKEFRKEHKLRVYDPIDDEVKYYIENSKLEEEQIRDKLLDYFSLKVEDDFSDLLKDKPELENNRITFLQVLSELITNSIFHGRTLVSALMHTKGNQTTLSISDTGIGFTSSLSKKENAQLLDKKLNKCESALKNPDFQSIFNAIFYSFQNHRKGLFDLIILVVVESKGIFRLHNVSAQFIISQRYISYFEKLYDLRKELYEVLQSKEMFEENIDRYSQILWDAEQIFNDVFNLTNKFYQENPLYSTSRFYQIKFPGVHIEVEI